MKTSEEIQEQIAKLKARQAEIEETYQDHLMYQANPHLKEEQLPLWKAAASFERWDKEHRAIEEQLRVLYWVSGKYERFPWR